MLQRINHQNPIKAGVVSRVSEYEFTSWHEYLGREGFFPLCNVNVVLGRIRIDELTALIPTVSKFRSLVRMSET